MDIHPNQPHGGKNGEADPSTTTKTTPAQPSRRRTRAIKSRAAPAQPHQDPQKARTPRAARPRGHARLYPPPKHEYENVNRLQFHMEPYARWRQMSRRRTGPGQEPKTRSFKLPLPHAMLRYCLHVNNCSIIASCNVVLLPFANFCSIIASSNEIFNMIIFNLSSC